MPGDDKPPQVHLNSLGDLISEVPNMLGFVPAHSLVLMCFEHAGEKPGTFLMMMRTDLPPAEQRRALASSAVPQMLHEVQAELVVALVVGGDRLEQRELIDELDAKSCQYGAELHALWTPVLSTGNTWICYHDTDCIGFVHDISASPLAATLVVAGHRTYSSREEIAQTIAPASHAERAAMQRQLNKWRSRTDPAQPLHDAAAPIFAAIECLRAGESLTAEETVAALGALNSNPRVRDMMARTYDDASATQLWTKLLRKAPDAYAADVAVLLATAAHARGDVGLANVALERALAASPTHPFANLLRHILKYPPQLLRTMIDDAASDLGRHVD